MRRSMQRKIILDIINNSNEHLDAYGLYYAAREKLSRISLGTIYRNLKSLVDTGEIDVIYDGTDKLRYDKREDHQHFLCTKCHKIIDIYDLDFKKTTNYKDNKVVSYKIVLEGLCENCQKEE